MKAPEPVPPAVEATTTMRRSGLIERPSSSSRCWLLTFCSTACVFWSSFWRKREYMWKNRRREIARTCPAPLPVSMRDRSALGSHSAMCGLVASSRW